MWFELRRTPYTRSTRSWQNPLQAKFAEQPFHSLGCFDLALLIISDSKGTKNPWPNRPGAYIDQYSLHPAIPCRPPFYGSLSPSPQFIPPRMQASTNDSSVPGCHASM